MEEHKRRQVEQRRLRVLQVSQKDVEEGEEVDDPLMVLGRFVKGAGKQLWRKVSRRDRDRQEREREREKGGKERELEKEKDGEEKGKTKSDDVAGLALTTISSNGEDKTEDTPTKEKEERRAVWEDANDFLNVGQTETFLEGRDAPYSS